MFKGSSACVSKPMLAHLKNLRGIYYLFLKPVDLLPTVRALSRALLELNKLVAVLEGV
jgi:hypothetical protein